MDLAYSCFFEQLTKQAAAIPREFGGGLSRAGRRPIRAALLLDKTKDKPKTGFPPSADDGPNANAPADQEDRREVTRVDYTPTATITAG